MWVPGIETESSTRATSALNHCAISQAPIQVVLRTNVKDWRRLAAAMKAWNTSINSPNLKALRSGQILWEIFIFIEV